MSLVEAIDTQLVEYKREWVVKGCSILSNEWQDSVVQKDIVNSPMGSVLIKSVEVFEVVKDPFTLF